MNNLRACSLVAAGFIGVSAGVFAWALESRHVTIAAISALSGIHSAVQAGVSSALKAYLMDRNTQ